MTVLTPSAAPTQLPQTTRQTSSGATLTSAHDMLFAVGAELLFVIVAVMIAGLSNNAANATIALMLVLLALNGLANLDVFSKFLTSHPLVPSGRSTTTNRPNTGFITA